MQAAHTRHFACTRFPATGSAFSAPVAPLTIGARHASQHAAAAVEDDDDNEDEDDKEEEAEEEEEEEEAVDDEKLG